MTNPTAGLGYLQRQMLNFIQRAPYPDARFYVPADRLSIKIAKSLERRGLIHLTDCGMCTVAGRTVYMAQAINNEQ
jgi:hypothetical protein